MAEIEFRKENHKYIVDGVEIASVTNILSSEGFIDNSFCDEPSRIRGDYVHQATHLYDLGMLDEETLDPALAGYLKAWKKFKADSDLKLLYSEKPLYSERYKFCGTPDKIGIAFGENIIIDIKSGSIPAWTVLQLAGYEMLILENNLFIKPIIRAAVQLKEDETYTLKFYKDRKDEQIFLSILVCYNWKKNNLRR